jgi:IrrE N-terminal-like domain
MMTGSIPPKTREILIHAEQILMQLGYRSGPVDVMKMLDLAFRQFGLVYDIVDELTDHKGNPQDACLDCGASPILRMRNQVYEDGLKWHPGSRFTVAHEMGHFFRHREEFTASRRLNRGKPGSGTSFATNPLQESEANAFAGAFLLPPSAVTIDTTANEVSRMFRISLPAAEHTLRRTRAAFPDKWSPGK